MKRSTRTDVLSEPVELDFVDTDGRRASLDADVVYDTTDPYAMSMIFKTSPPVTWTFSRELLITGMHEPAGEGDVHVWPCLTGEGESVVILELSSPDGEVLVQAGLSSCARFADRMQRSVPLGEEVDHLDLDTAIGRLLGDAPDRQA